jgi:hypothetical protein
MHLDLANFYSKIAVAYTRTGRETRLIVAIDGASQTVLD